MSYTPPAGDAIDLILGPATYSAPDPTAIPFAFVITSVGGGYEGFCPHGPAPDWSLPVPTLPVIYRDYEAYVRFTIEATAYAWGSVAGFRAGQWHEPRLSAFPGPTDSFRDEWGLVNEDRVSVTVVDTTGELLPLTSALTGTTVELELLTRRQLTDGATQAVAVSRRALVDAITRTPAALSLELIDLDRSQLEAEYPSRRFTVEDWPELTADAVGKPVPVVVGTAIKVPFVLASHNNHHGPWRYAGPEWVLDETLTVLTVYRDGRIVAPGEYTVGTTDIGPYTVLHLSFNQEQLDFQCRAMVLTADLDSSLSRNAGTELCRLLTWADIAHVGIDTDYAAEQAMWVDSGYVQPRRLGAIIQDLLLILRGHLYRAADGAWVLVQDRDRTPLAAWNEAVREAIEIQSYQQRRRLATLELEYRPRTSQDPLDLQHVISRELPGGVGTARIVAPYIRDHETADRLLAYLAAKADWAATARASIHDVQLPLGGVITLVNPLLWMGEKAFIVQRVSRAEDRNDLELIEYATAVYDYVPGTLPGDAVSGYQPDYALTPPKPPAASRWSPMPCSSTRTGRPFLT